MKSATRLKEERQSLMRLLMQRGIKDEAVLGAMMEVPREQFVSALMADDAYRDAPLPIAGGQTISQPYIVALMTEAMNLHSGDKVLEIGTGSGYAAAVLSRIVKAVFSVERHEKLIRTAEQRLRNLGYDNVRVHHGDGTQGWSEHAPFDAIVVTAGGPEVPRSLVKQLAIGGRLVIPTGQNQREQQLLRVTRITEEETTTDVLCAVRFVPLIGEEGWSSDDLASPIFKANKA